MRRALAKLLNPIPWVVAFLFLVSPLHGRSKDWIDWKIETDFSLQPEGFYAVIACDGEGGYGVSLSPDRKQKYESATRAHEENHIRFLRTFFPGWCKGAPRGFTPSIYHIRTKRYAECLAYLAGFRTLARIDFSYAHSKWRWARFAYGCPGLRDMYRQQYRLDAFYKDLRAKLGRAGIAWRERSLYPMFLIDREGEETLSYAPDPDTPSPGYPPNE